MREAVDKYWQQQDEMNRVLTDLYGVDLNAELGAGREYHGPIKAAPPVNEGQLKKRLEVAQQRAAADWAAYQEAKTRSAEASERSDVRILTALVS